jgi:hypothetical protein
MSHFTNDDEHDDGMTIHKYTSNSQSWRKPHGYREMTLMTAMTMNYRGFLKGVRHSAVESRDRAMS